MPIRVKCACGKQFGAPEKYAGKRAKCPACGQPIVIPPAKEQARAPVPSGGGAQATAASKITATCACGQAVSAKASLAGKTVQCPACKKPLKIPRVNSAAPRATGSPSQDRAGGPSRASSGARPSPVDDLFDEVGIAPPPGLEIGGPPPARRCPECKAGMAEEAIICIQCGYNEQLGRKMETVRPKTQEDRKKRAAK